MSSVFNYNCIYYYSNGTALGFLQTPTILPNGLRSYNFIGLEWFLSGNTLNGYMDNFRIYIRALSNHEVFLLFYL